MAALSLHIDMPELTAKQTAELAQTLTAVLALTPPPSPKGRYALARWGIATEAPAASYSKKMGALIDAVAAPESIKQHVGGLTFDFKDADTRALYTTECAVIDAEIVTLSGVRVVTHAELGACPITGAQEKMLMQCGVLEQIEPD